MKTFVRRLTEISHEHKLKGYYRVVQFLGPLAVLVAGYFITLFPTYFNFLGPALHVRFLFVSVFIAHIICLFLHEIFKRKIYFTMLRYAWVVFFMGLMFTSGGLGSPITYFFIFSILVAAVDMEEKDVLQTALIIFAFLLSLFFVYPDAPLEDKVLHGFTIFILGLISFMIYKLAKEKEEIHRDYDRLVSIDHLKGDFISVASNRLRTPITGLLYALTELSEGKSTEEEKKKIIEGGLRQSKTAIGIVNELTEAIELDSYHLTILPEPINLAEIIREIADELKYLVKKKETQFIVDVPFILTIRANTKMIKQAIINVVDNAIRYSPGGTVKIWMRGVADVCHINIEDNGIGIEEKDFPLVFERLYRGNNAEHIEPNRSGIGLFTTKRIVGLHHGTITFTSATGKGTTVHISLPMI